MSRDEVAATGTRAPAVRQAFLVLDELCESPGGLRLNEVLQRVDLPKSTVHRILRTLVEVGAVVHQPRSGTYRIGPGMAVYSRHVVSAGTGLLGMFYALAEQLRDTWDETVQLGVLTGTEVTFIAHVDTCQPVRLFTRVGRRLPAHASATGKALLALRGSAELDAVLATGLPALTPRTVGDAEQFRAQLAEVRTRGYATEVEEAAANLSCYSAPVLGGDGRALAAVTVCVANNAVPADRAGQLADAVVRTAAEMSRHL
ncbi:IclR family transcriptional regulator [Saccharopolyspora erythraea]|uniref:IclR family transcriptional regulator n=1 Tax=Saccharopolyspora erythraea TaxID=1836 RepID=UPI001BAA3D7B|nr:IclR family transcriptional regulator [Saccharopolyspora erythraea]QUH03858.1 IclR family transcriptional regulator [Saccharopolyspora erythraea]